MRHTWIVGLALVFALAAAASAEPVPRSAADAEFNRLFEAGQFEAAAAQARQVVELTEQANPPRPDDLQAALMNLALAERRAGDFLAAESSYLRVIELLETAGRLTSPRLARAHAGLALTYYDARRYDLAASSFERAVALSRRADGLFNETQLPLLDRQAIALTELGRTEEALLARRYALRLTERRHGAESLPYARQLELLARWYTRVGAYDASRATLRRCIDVIVALQGPQSTELIGPLTAAAENARRWLADPQLREATADAERREMFHDPTMPTPPSLALATIAAEGQKALERAVAIVDAQPDASPQMAAGVQAQLGDWHQARQQPDKALPYYRKAWQIAGKAQDAAALRRTMFDAPLLLYYLVPDGWDRYARRPADEVDFINVEVELTVTAQGGTTDARAAPDLDQDLAAPVLRAAASARYRPRLVDGEPLATSGVRFVQPWYALRDTDKAAAAQGGG
jgi:tetratricopeptide (TPR) repeat protein